MGSTIGNAYWLPEDTRTIEKILAEVNRKMYEEKRSKGETAKHRIEATVGWPSRRFPKRERASGRVRRFSESGRFPVSGEGEAKAC